MTHLDETKEGTVPEGPGRAMAVASALAVGAALAGAAVRQAPAEPEFSHEDPPVPPEADPAACVANATSVLRAVLEGLRSDEIVVRREAAGVVERLARDPDPRRRLVLAAALRDLGGRASVLSLCLLVGDEDPSVRLVARRALLAESKR